MLGAPPQRLTNIADVRVSIIWGSGDNYKFLHDRSDCKQGWQLDKDWETVAKGKKLAGSIVATARRDKLEEEADDDALLDSIPLACFICKGHSL